MIIASKEIVTYQGGDWQEFIDTKGLEDIFGDLIRAYIDRTDYIKPIICFIVWAYSLDSEKIHLQMDWQTNKEMIFEDCMFPVPDPDGAMKNAVLKFKDPNILTAAHRWLFYQGGQAFSNYQMLRDLQLEMRMSANGFIPKSSGGNDYDQKFKNAEYVEKLRTMIKKAEDELIQNNEKLESAAKEVFKKSKNTMGPEMFAR